MRHLKLLSFITLSILARISAAEETVPAWVATYGQVAESEMTAGIQAAFRHRIKEMHLEHSQNEWLANVWTINGTLPIIGSGYYLLAKDAAKEVGTPCLYELKSMKNFCITGSQTILSRLKNKSLSGRIRKGAIITTMREIKGLSFEKAALLKSEAIKVQNEIIEKTEDKEIPPLQYRYLAELSAFTEALDPHSFIARTETIDGMMNYDLTVTKSGDVITIKFDTFGSDLTKNIAAKLKLLYVVGDRILLDLRGNGGGRLDEAMALTKMFLAEDYQNGDDDKLLYKSVEAPMGIKIPKEILTDHYKAPVHYPNAPLVVLVNERTASASEVVAALLQQEGRSVIVGNRTYGKGTAMNFIEIVQDKIYASVANIALYLRNGESVQGKGVVPEVEFDLSTERGAQTIREEDFANTVELARLPFAAGNSQSIDAAVLACAADLAEQRGGRQPLESDREAQDFALATLKICYPAIGPTLTFAR